MRKVSTIAWGMLLAGLVAAPALAQGTTTPAPPPPASDKAPAPAKIWTVSTGLDFTSAYMFRGIRQSSDGTIAQPFGDLGLTFAHGISANVGTWNSVHSTNAAGKWYERDYYGAVNFTAGKLKPGLLYTQYTSPADSFTTVNELAGVLAVDDSARKFPLAPKAILAFELTHGQADAGANKGVYLELGVRPSVKLAKKLTLAIPTKTGLSLKDYYEGPTGNNHFGYFDTGGILGVPVASTKSGTLEVHGGVDLMWLGDNLTIVNGGDRFRPIASVGFSFVY
jgi:hypothetical protein